MKRRSFIKKTGLATTGALIIPYILPSGRLFAATGSRKANHVVFCLFAGGVRNLESIQKADGNLMPNTLNGSEAISSDIACSITSLPTINASALQNYGTLYKQFRYAQGPIGHFNGHTTALTGNYTTRDLDIKIHPDYPTVFEYYRKHSSPSNSPFNSWWISNGLGPYPSLKYSTFSGYGAHYAANYFQPASILNAKAKEGNKLNEAIDTVSLYDNFTLKSFSEAVKGQYLNPWDLTPGSMNGDMYNVFFAEKILQEFKPELLVVNMQEADIAHSNFSRYCNNLRKADYALAHLWNTIQNTPGLANDTVLIVAPEHGRNFETNTLLDENGRYALDHTADQMAREIFCLIVGPPSVIKQNNEINSIKGESIDILPTIANILGFDNEIPSGMLQGNVLTEAFR
jgi:arylsulfatase A-like enzyme